MPISATAMFKFAQLMPFTIVPFHKLGQLIWEIRKVRSAPNQLGQL